MSETRTLAFDVAVIGGGPAGIAAAIAAAESGASVALIDDNPRPGGQIWRGGPGATHHGEASNWLARLDHSKVTKLYGTRVFSAGEGVLEAESDDAVIRMDYRSLVLATGARERFLPFPGWTLPNVLGAGGLQALVKSGLPIEGKRVIVAGTGPLLLAVAAYMKEHGAKVLCICEQTTWTKFMEFGARMTLLPGKIREALRLRFQIRGVPYRTSCWPVSALGSDQLESVKISDHGEIREIECDYLACGFHLVPNIELARLIGCEIKDDFVSVDARQQTSVPNVYCAGEPTGIGGLDLSLIEGRIAGYAAAGDEEAARKLAPRRASYRKVVPLMAEAFRLRPELKRLARTDTFVCRCEDVPLERLRDFDSWRAAKLQTRCGMGPCQGRVCGPATEFLFGWQVDSVRPPVFAVKCSSLAEMAVAGGEKHV